MPTPRQQMHSCDRCRRRKVRCNWIGETPCGACAKSGVDCTFTTNWRRQRRQTPASSGSAAATAPGGTSGTQQTPTDSGGTIVVPEEQPHESGSTLSQSSPRGHLPSSHPVGNAESIAPSSEVAQTLDLAGNGLYRFFKDGIPSSTWDVFHPLDQIRICYVGTQLSNLSQLTKLDCPSQSFLIYPYPQIHPPRPWIPVSPQGGVQDILLDVTSFPAKEMRDEFVDAFFCKISPYFPIIDESGFRAQYADPQNQPPLLILHSILLVGAHASSHPRAVQARHVVKAILFRRAKALFDMRHEHDRLHLVQAALLFTWHLQNEDTVSSNSYYWIGVACRIAFGLGMHRNILKEPYTPGRMPILDRLLWRRVWWTLFQVEALSSLEHGRPSLIRLEDFDCDPFSLDDLREAGGTLNTRVDMGYCLRNIELCYIALELTNLSAPRCLAQDIDQRVASINTRLISLILSLPSSTSNTHASFGDLNIRLHYHTVVIHMCRFAMDRASLSEKYDEMWNISRGATSAIISTLEALHTGNMMEQCHFTAVAALTSAAIHVSKDIQQALAGISTMVAVNDVHQLERICKVAEYLSPYWPNAEGVRRLFHSLRDKFTAVLNASRGDNTHSEGFPIDAALRDVNWEEIFGYPLDDGQALNSDHGWDAALFESRSQ